MLDGLKPGQRKILFACFKRNLKKDIKARRGTVHQESPPALNALPCPFFPA
jgi:hypothetical protein